MCLLTRRLRHTLRIKRNIVVSRRWKFGEVRKQVGTKVENKTTGGKKIPAKRVHGTVCKGLLLRRAEAKGGDAGLLWYHGAVSAVPEVHDSRVTRELSHVTRSLPRTADQHTSVQQRGAARVRTREIVL